MMATRQAAKRYVLGRPMKMADANRLLGLPKQQEMSWEELQKKASSIKSGIKHKS